VRKKGKGGRSFFKRMLLSHLTLSEKGGKKGEKAKWKLVKGKKKFSTLQCARWEGWKCLKGKKENKGKWRISRIKRGSFLGSTLVTTPIDRPAQRYFRVTWG